jgi:hypothetical protein
MSMPAAAVAARSHTARPVKRDLSAIEKEIYSDPPAPETPEVELINGAMRNVDGRFVSKHVPLLMGLARNESPFIALQAVVALRKKVAEIEREAVEVARAADWPWRDIGEMFGITASAAYRRYGR